jgi:dUTP pyrophosphatase
MIENKPKLYLYKLRDNAVTPTYGTNDSACFDIAAAFDADIPITIYDCHNQKRTHFGDVIWIDAGERALIPTGWIFGIPEGYSMRIHPRSGLSLKNGIVLANAEAVIDADYINETFIMLHNISSEVFKIETGMRLAQGELVEKIDHSFEIKYNTLPQETTRSGGLGSTGI